jgi:hypothetical protein
MPRDATTDKAWGSMIEGIRRDRTIGLQPWWCTLPGRKIEHGTEQEIDVDVGGSMGKSHKSIRFDYVNVHPPAGVQ